MSENNLLTTSIFYTDDLSCIMWSNVPDSLISFHEKRQTENARATIMRHCVTMLRTTDLKQVAYSGVMEILPPKTALFRQGDRPEVGADGPETFVALLIIAGQMCRKADHCMVHVSYDKQFRRRFWGVSLPIYAVHTMHG
eukprot:scaffold395942_cov42-Prasinocladus_malaysianus.AAC.1